MRRLMRRLIPLIEDTGRILLAILIVGAAFVWIASFSSSFKSCQNDEAKQKAAQSAEEHQSTVHVFITTTYRCTGEFIDANHGPVGAVATILIAAFTATIWLISRTQLRHSQRIERAYISCGGAGHIVAEPVIGPNGQPVIGPNGVPVHTFQFAGDFSVHINNHGKTPGEVIAIAIEFCDPNAVPREPIYNRRHHHNWIGPGTQSRVLFPVTPPGHLPDQMIVYGRVFFRDVFSSTEHWASFFQNFNRQTGHSDSIRPPSRVYTEWDHDDR